MKVKDRINEMGIGERINCKCNEVYSTAIYRCKDALFKTFNYNTNSRDQEDTILSREGLLKRYGSKKVL